MALRKSNERISIIDIFYFMDSWHIFTHTITQLQTKRYDTKGFPAVYRHHTLHTYREIKIELTVVLLVFFCYIFLIPDLDAGFICLYATSVQTPNGLGQQDYAF